MVGAPLPQLTQNTATDAATATRAAGCAQGAPFRVFEVVRTSVTELSIRVRTLIGYRKQKLE